MLRTIWNSLTSWFRYLRYGRGHSLEELARRLDMSIEEIQNVERKYNVFQIRKKSGKHRSIAAPNARLKSLQRRILRRLLAKLKSHSQATGFEPGISFLDNARCHQSQAIVIKIDLVDFFPSIDQKRIANYFRRIGWGKAATNLLTELTTFNGVLPQGAPTSPRLSNLVNYGLDVRLAEYVARQNIGGIFTRYADDITVSFSNGQFTDVEEVVNNLLRIIRDEGYRPHIGRKFDVRRAHQRQVVTGLVVNDRARLPREKRRWLRAVQHRREKYRRGGTLCHPPTLTDEQLQGWLSLQRMIDSGHDRARS